MFTDLYYFIDNECINVVIEILVSFFLITRKNKHSPIIFTKGDRRGGFYRSD